MDLGIWATWYNLPDESRDRYIEWAHSAYLPYLRQTPGYSWVAHYRHQGGGAKMKKVEETVVGRTTDDVGNGSQYKWASVCHELLARSSSRPSASV